jgi:putative transposase
VAALHRKIANQRRDFLHQTCARLIGLIGLSVTKRLVIQSMTANGGRRKRGLNGETLSTAPGLFLQILASKREESLRSIYGSMDEAIETLAHLSPLRRVEKTLAGRVHQYPCEVTCPQDDNSALVLLYDALTSRNWLGVEKSPEWFP